MPTLRNSIRYIFGKEELQGKPQLSEENRTAFQQFYRQQAVRITSHHRYEQDLNASLESTDHVLVRFDIDEYVREIHEYFVRNLLYRHFSEQEFHQLVIGILVPDQTIREILSRESRRRIFAGTLRNIAANSTVPLQKMIKFYYDYICLQQQPVNGMPPQEVLELFKESVALLEREQREPKIHAAAAEEILQHQAMISGIVGAFGIREKRQLEEIFSPALPLNYLFSVLLIVGAGAVLVIPVGMEIMRMALEQLVPTEQLSVFRTPALLILGLLFLSTTVRYRLRMQKRRLLTRCLQAVSTDQKIRPEETAAFFRSRFGFEWGKR